MILTPEIITQTDSLIDTNRKININIKIQKKGLFGTVLVKNTPVKSTLISHEFLFGCNLGGIGAIPNFDKEFLSIFNYGTLGLGWKDLVHGTTSNQYDFEFTKAVINWCKTNSIIFKGHPLVYNLKEILPQEFQNRFPTDTEWLEHIEEILTNLSSDLRMFDTVNEPAHVSGINKWELYFNAVKDYNYYITNIVNDYFLDKLSDFNAYYGKLSFLSALNAKFDVIGCQAHVYPTNLPDWNTYFNNINTLVNDFKKPIHITEVSLYDGKSNQGDNIIWNEDVQAEQLELLYRLGFSNKNVNAITYWYLYDGDSWRPTGGLIKLNGTYKKAYTKLKDLIKNKWTTNISKSTDSSGYLKFNGFKGKYTLSLLNKTYTINAKDSNTITLTI